MLRRYLPSLPYFLVYEGEGTAVTDPPAVTDDDGGGKGGNGDGDKDKTKKTKVAFTKEQQDWINAQLAEERRKGAEKNQQLITQLEAQKQRSDTSESEKAAIETRIEQLRGEYATKEEQAKKTMEQQVKVANERAIKSEADAKDWRGRFEAKMIDVDLIGAAVEARAYNPNTVKAILQPVTRITEELDEEGKPTGQYTTRVKMNQKSKEGKVQVLEMTPAEAVKFLSEQEEHGNLFISGAAGGLGGHNLGGGRGGSGGGKGENEPPKDTDEYMKWRAAQKKKA
jgi:hypothetical protein